MDAQRGKGRLPDVRRGVAALSLPVARGTVRFYDSGIGQGQCP